MPRRYWSSGGRVSWYVVGPMLVARISAMRALMSAAVAGVLARAFFNSISIASVVILRTSGVVAGVVPSRARRISGCNPWRIRASTCCARGPSSRLENAARPSSLRRQ